MSEQNQQQLMGLNEMEYENEIFHVVNHNKPANTTKITKKQQNFNQNCDFVFGKNRLLNKSQLQNTDSSSQDSEISFEERLQLKYDDILPENIVQILENNHIYDVKQNQLVQQKASKQLISHLEEKCVDNVSQLYGFEQAHQIKNILKFLRRKQTFAKVYFKMLRIFNSKYLHQICFLLKESLSFYLLARQQIRKQNSSMTQDLISSYVKDHSHLLSTEIRSNQKMGSFHPVEDENQKVKFEILIQNWINNFILCWQGYPLNNDNHKKIKYNQVDQDYISGNSRKKIKKN